MYGSVLSKKNQEYSKSGFINLRAGLNRYLRQPPFKRTLDLMNDREFTQANQVFSGRIRDNKEKGLDVSQPKEPIDKADMEKLFNDYFYKGLEKEDTQVLVHKVFFDLVYYTGRRGKEGLRSLTKNSFNVDVGPDGHEFVQITFNEKTKKNQGDNNSSSGRALHNNRHIISAIPEDPLCPVNSFKVYASLLNEGDPSFFQHPNKAHTGYDKEPIGKNTLGDYMKQISKAAKLSKIYTNHQIRKTTATALYRSGYDLNQVAHVTKHKNLDALKLYVAGPSYDDKKGYNEALKKYAQNPTATRRPSQPPRSASPLKEKNSKETKSTEPEPKRKKTETKQTKKNNKSNPTVQENVEREDCVVPMYPESDDENNRELVVKSQQNVVNQLRQASNLFQNANFTNCNFTFQLPK